MNKNLMSVNYENTPSLRNAYSQRSQTRRKTKNNDTNVTKTQNVKGGGASDVANLMVPFGLILAKESLESFLKKGYNTTFLNEQTEQNAYTNKMTPKKNTKSKPESGRKVSMSKVTQKMKNKTKTNNSKTNAATNNTQNDIRSTVRGGSGCSCSKQQQTDKS